MSLPRNFNRGQDERRFSMSSKNSPVVTRTNAFSILPPLSPHIPGPPSTPKPFRFAAPTMSKREKSAFVILTEISRSRSPSPPGGRVSPFRGRGFKPPVSSRHATPPPDPKEKSRTGRSRAKTGTAEKGVSGKSAPTSPSKKSNIPKSIILRRSSLSPNRAREVANNNTNTNNVNNRLLHVKTTPLNNKEIPNKLPLSTPKKVPGKQRNGMKTKSPQTPVPIGRQRPLEKGVFPVDTNNNDGMKNEKNKVVSTVRNKTELNKKRLDKKEEKENTTLTNKKSVKNINARVSRSPGKNTQKDDVPRRPSQKPLPSPARVKTKEKAKDKVEKLNEVNEKKRSPLVTQKNIPSMSSNDVKINNKINSNTTNTTNSPSRTATTPKSKTLSSPQKKGLSNITKNPEPSSAQNLKTDNFNNNISSQSMSKNTNGNNTNTTGDRFEKKDAPSESRSEAKGETKRKDVGNVTKVEAETEVEVVNEKKNKNGDKKSESPKKSPAKSRPSSEKSGTQGDEEIPESSVALIKTATASAMAPAEPSSLPKITSTVTATESSSSSPVKIKKVGRVPTRRDSRITGLGPGSTRYSKESVRTNTSMDTVRAVARVKGTIKGGAASSHAGKVKGEPEMEVLSANTLMRMDNESNQSSSRVAWDSPANSRPEETADPISSSAKPTGCLGNICKLLNCCKSCQNWQKPVKPAVPEKRGLWQRLNCFNRCPSFRIPSKIRSAWSKMNCCRNIKLSSCCKKLSCSSCCKKLSCSSCCKRMSCSSCCRRRQSMDDSSGTEGTDGSDEPKIKCANLKRCWRFSFCLNRGCCQRVRQMCRCSRLGCCKPGGCCGRTSPDDEAIAKKNQAKATLKKSRTSSLFSDIPKLDPTLVDYNSIMRAAIPVLPVPVAWMCLIFNLFLPGFGTFWSGLMCLCFGKPRFSVNDTPLARIGAFFVDLMVGLAQAFTVLFCLVGWGWGIWWGVIMLRIAKKNRRIKLAEAGGQENRPAPVMLNQNHDAERGQTSMRA